MAAKPAIIQLVETIGQTNLPTHQALKQYDPSEHDVFDRGKRKKRKLIVPNGQTKIVGTGKDAKEVDITKTVYEEVNRIGIPMQKFIVDTRVAFMNTGQMNIIAKPVTPAEITMLEMVKKTRSDNKLEFKMAEIAERQMSELEVAELWYSEDVEKGYWGDLAPNSTKRMRMKIISPALGDKLLPVFDSNGTMIYFARAYKSAPDLTSLINFDSPDESGSLPTYQKEVEHLDIYSAQGVLLFEMDESSVWVLKDTIKYTYEGLPIIYYPQPGGKPEWHDCQPIIERIETLVSNFGDTNDANGSPILFAKGIIKSMPHRGETAKVINVVPQIDKDGKEVGDADLKYVNWDRAPDSIKLELETLVNFVYTYTNTPDISTKGMAELSIQSGTGFDRVFISAHLAAKKHTQGSFGMSVQRSLNFCVKACAAINTGIKSAINLSLKADFPIFRINDEADTVNTLMAATGGKQILSQKTAVGMTGFVQDPEAEFKQIEKEADTLGIDVTGNEPPAQTT